MQYYICTDIYVHIYSTQSKGGHKGDSTSADSVGNKLRTMLTRDSQDRSTFVACRYLRHIMS